MKRWLGWFGILILAVMVTVIVRNRMRRSEWEARYDRIEAGMTEPQVIAILGPPGDRDTRTPSLVWLRWKFPYEGREIEIHVGFDNAGRVVGMGIHGHRLATDFLGRPIEIKASED